MTQQDVDWNKIKSEFLAGTTLKSLAEKYSISFSTLKSRHTRENWSNLRSKTEEKMQEQVISKIANEQAKKALDAVHVIDKAVEHLSEELINAECLSKEGLARAISELLKTRGTYTGETINKNKMELQGEVKLDANVVYRTVIEHLEARRKERNKSSAI